MSQLEEKLNEYQDKNYEAMNSEEVALFEQTQADFEAFQDERMQGVIFRSQVKWYNEGEAVTKYFFNLEKSKASVKGMSSLIKESGKECRNPEHILHEQEQFYKKLYKSESTQYFDYQNDQSIKNLTKC